MTWWAGYIGLPYDTAHCWELVRRVYQDHRGIDLPSYGEVSARDLVRVAREIGKGQEAWEPVDVPQAFDVALMRGRSAVWHVGVMTDAKNVLHTERATNAVRVPIDALHMRGRITGFRRFRGDDLLRL
jgi:cell wall-associated NlpC family hydrolase